MAKVHVDKAKRRAGEVEERMAQLKGRSRSDLIPDQDRQSLSPLGHGSHSEPQPKKKGQR